MSLASICESMFKAGQDPSFWLSSAIRLFEAAEIIFDSQELIKVEYDRAFEAAVEEADRTGRADILSEQPNYQPAEMLCGFAIENALKGIIVANEPSRISDTQLDRELRVHNLVELARLAKIQLSFEEGHICTNLSTVVEWAGRYPVATKAEKQIIGARDQLIDWEDVPVLRIFCRKIIDALKERVDHQLPRYGMIVNLTNVNEDGEDESDT